MVIIQTKEYESKKYLFKIIDKFVCERREYLETFCDFSKYSIRL